jgi:hypothetical protein
MPANARTHFLPILAGALLLRLAAVLSMLRHSPQTWFYPQATELARLGESLRRGRGLASPFGGDTGPSAFLAPGYPALVALLFRIFGSYSGHAAVALLLLQVLFAVGTVYFVMLVARLAFSPRTANIAGAIWAFSPVLWWMPAVFWESGLSTTILTASLAFAMHCAAKPTPWKWMAMGAFFAAAMLINPSLMLALLSVGAWAIYRTAPSPRLVAAALLFVTCATLFAAWPVRNERELHAFIPLRSNFGYELWQGNRSGADGEFSAQLHLNVNAQEFARYASLGEVGYMRRDPRAARPLHPADGEAGCAVLAGRVVAPLFHAHRAVSSDNDDAGAGWLCPPVEAPPRPGPALRRATASLSSALLHHPRGLSISIGAGSAGHPSLRLRSCALDGSKAGNGILRIFRQRTARGLSIK